MPEQVTRSIIVKGSANKIFGLWADFENLPHFMKNVKSVRNTGDRTSHWVMQGPMGKDIEWNAQVTLFEPNTRIAWSSIEGDIKTSGQVTFTQLSHDETQVTVMMQYVPPAGKAGQAIGQVLGDPDNKLEEDLNNFKAYAEGMYDRIKL